MTTPSFYLGAQRALDGTGTPERLDLPAASFLPFDDLKSGGTLPIMQALKAQVKNGRLVLDEPTDLPEGQIVELVPVDDVLANGGDDLSDEERAALHASIEEGERELDAGQVIGEKELWARLRAIP